MDFDLIYTPIAKRPDPAAPTLLRHLWTMTKPGKKPITAAIYQRTAGRELRIHRGADADDLIDSLLSRGGELPLTFRADERMALLLEHGWMDDRAAG